MKKKRKKPFGIHEQQLYSIDLFARMDPESSKMITMELYRNAYCVDVKMKQQNVRIPFTIEP